MSNSNDSKISDWLKFDSFEDPNNAIFKVKSKTNDSWCLVEDNLDYQPLGLESASLMTGVKYPDVLDCSLVKMPVGSTVSGVFTTNRSCSPSVKISKQNLASGTAELVAVFSKNANLFTESAYKDTESLIAKLAEEFGIDKTDVLIACTGVIGVNFPLQKVSKQLDNIGPKLKDRIDVNTVEAIMTTDIAPKYCSVKIGNVNIAGYVKGAGMVEPNMATMLGFFYTDLSVDSKTLDIILRRVVDKTFNRISVDSDTSTSDTVLLSSTRKGKSPASSDDIIDLERGLYALSLKLCRKMLIQSEGATTLIEAKVSGAQSKTHADAVTKKIINSPLLKAAIFGADPNWGRIAMAIGKPIDGIEGRLDMSKITIALNGTILFKENSSTGFNFTELSKEIKESKVIEIEVNLDEGDYSSVAWGCDLSYEYVKINAEYTT